MDSWKIHRMITERWREAHIVEVKRGVIIGRSMWTGARQDDVLDHRQQAIKVQWQ